MFDIITVFCCCCCCFCYCLFVCLVCVFLGVGVLFSFLSSNGAGFCFCFCLFVCLFVCCLLFVCFSIVLPTFHDVLCDLNLLRRGGEWYDQAVGNINQNIHDCHTQKNGTENMCYRRNTLSILYRHISLGCF